MRRVHVMQEKICDLHIHSNCSDGTCSPEELIDIAEQAGLYAVALCDHNTVKGLRRFLNAAKGKDIIAIPGVEVSCQFKSKEVHILGLFLKEDVFDDLESFFVELNIRKMESNEILLENLNKAGYKIDIQDVFDLSESGIPNRVHFAKVLLNKGYVSSIDEAFKSLLSKDGGIYIESKKLEAFETIKYLSEIDAVPVIAHPLQSLSLEEVEEFLPQAKELGLVGMECIYPLYDEVKTRQAHQLAESFDMKVSRDSDFHGENKPNIHIGVGENNIKVPFSVYEGLNPYFKD